MIKNRFVLRLSAADSALLSRLRNSTNLTRKSEIVHAALFHFWQFWRSKSFGTRIVLVHHEKRQEFAIHLDRVSAPGPDDMVVRDSQMLKVVSHEFALSADDISVLKVLFEEGVAPTQSQIIREALALYASIVQYLSDGWKAFFRSDSDIPIVICGVQEMSAVCPAPAGKGIVAAEPTPWVHKIQLASYSSRTPASPQIMDSEHNHVKLSVEPEDAQMGIVSYLPSGEEGTGHALQG